MVAEIASRVESVGGFRRAAEGLGFRLHKHSALSDGFFLAFLLHKTGKPKKNPPPLNLKPCSYKKR